MVALPVEKTMNDALPKFETHLDRSHASDHLSPMVSPLSGLSTNDSNPQSTTLSPSSGKEEIEAAVVLISLPSTKLCRMQAPPFIPDILADVPLCIAMDPGNEESRPTSPLSPRHSSRAASIPAFVGANDRPTQTNSRNTSLYLPEDHDSLSQLHCFMRRYCVEAFSATEKDVAIPRYGKAHGVKVVVGQVGIRCLHCRHLSPLLQPERSVSYPSTLRNIYHSIETWQRRHSPRCMHIPGWIKRELVDLLQLSRTGAGGRRQYWEDSARRLGLVDTPHGIRFSCDPATEMRMMSAQVRPPQVREIHPVPSVLVQEADKSLVSDFLYLLILQMERCVFTEEDRAGGRSKVKDCAVGFSGMQCMHCQGKAGYGRYFPSSLEALALANSDRNIYNHIRKCRRCPSSVRQKLETHHREHADRTSKHKRGSRKLFFSRVWQRIHACDENDGSDSGNLDYA